MNVKTEPGTNLWVYEKWIGYTDNKNDRLFKISVGIP